LNEVQFFDRHFGQRPRWYPRFSIAGLRSNEASVRVHERDTIVSYALTGDSQPYTPIHGVGDGVKSDFVDPQIAAIAAERLGGGLTGSQLESGGIGFIAHNANEVEMTYSGGSSPLAASRRLGAYVAELVVERRATRRKPLVAAAQRLRARGLAAAAQRLQTAADGLDRQIHHSDPLRHHRVVQSLSVRRWSTTITAGHS
jgi:hypothetical protein